MSALDKPGPNSTTARNPNTHTIHTQLSALEQANWEATLKFIVHQQHNLLPTLCGCNSVRTHSFHKLTWPKHGPAGSSSKSCPTAVTTCKRSSCQWTTNCCQKLLLHAIFVSPSSHSPARYKPQQYKQRFQHHGVRITHGLPPPRAAPTMRSCGRWVSAAAREGSHDAPTSSRHPSRQMQRRRHQLCWTPARAA